MNPDKPTDAGAVRGGAGEGLPAAIIVVLALIIIFVAVAIARRTPGSPLWASAPYAPCAPSGRRYAVAGVLAEGFDAPDSASADAVAGDDAPERRSVHAALSRLYSTADADPLVTGQLYAFSDGVRPVYAQRTSHGDVYGLTEYSSSGAPGDLGVDVGPYGLAEYGGKIVGFDDGIPEPWALPSTPMRWYGPKKRDYYGVEGPTVYAEGLFSLSEPDHDPLVG